MCPVICLMELCSGKRNFSYTTFLAGISEIYDGTMWDDWHDGIYANEVGMVLPGQSVGEVVGLRSTINSCSIPEVLFKGSIILLSWGGGLPAKKKR